jgi:hypothetical protein
MKICEKYPLSIPIPYGTDAEIHVETMMRKFFNSTRGGIEKVPFSFVLAKRCNNVGMASLLRDGAFIRKS